MDVRKAEQKITRLQNEARQHKELQEQHKQTRWMKLGKIEAFREIMQEEQRNSQNERKIEEIPETD